MPTDKGANAGLKVASLVAGMVAGADSIDDMALLRHGGMGRVFARAYAPSTLGSFLRAFTFGHVRQLDAVASRFLIALAGLTRLLGAGRPAEPVSDDGRVRVGRCRRHDHRGPRSRQAGRRVRLLRGPRAERAAGHAVATATTAPVIVAQRLRKGACRVAARREASGRRRREDRPPLLGKSQPVLVRMDSAFYGRGTGPRRAGRWRDVSVTVRMDPGRQAAIAAIADDAWTTIEYTDAVFDETTGRWISRAEVAEVAVHRVRRAEEGRAGPRPARGPPDPGPQRRKNKAAGQDTLFDVWRFHAFFTTTDPASSTPSPRTRPTAGTRSSSRSTPT